MREVLQTGAVVVAFCLLAAGNVTATVTFHGLDEPLEKNARLLMPLATAPCDSAPWRIERLFNNADDALRKALEALGYYRFEVTKSLSFDNKDCWSAEFRVTLGEPVRLRRVDVTVSGEARDDSWLSQQVWLQRPAPGAVLNHGEYEKFKRFLLTAVRSRGYFDAHLTRNMVTVDETLSSADIVLELDSGPRYYFGKIDYEQDVLRPGLLAGYPEFREGDPYDATAISKLYESLSGSGYFGSVTISAEPVRDGSREVPVVVSITPGMRRVYTAGLGFATDIGLQGRLGYTDRRINDRGHQFDARLFLSDVDSSLSATYRWPRGDPKAEWVDVFGGLQQKNTDTSESDKFTLGIRVARNRSPDWLETPYINFSGENFRVGDQVDRSRLIMPGISWESTIGRQIGRVTSGHRIWLDIRGSADSFGSDTNFLQITGTTKWALPLGELNRALLRAELGTTFKRDFEELPASVRFFAGGDHSVRGYGFETLGPTDDMGNVIGGSYLATFSAEFDRLIAAKWSVAAFVDTGNAFDNLDFNFRTGVGIGVRWYSPIGPIRVDLAHPLDDPSREYRVHISLGPDI